MGFLELLNYALVSNADITTDLLIETSSNHVEIANPKTIEF